MMMPEWRAERGGGGAGSGLAEVGDRGLGDEVEAAATETVRAPRTDAHRVHPPTPPPSHRKHAISSARTRTRTRTRTHALAGPHPRAEGAGGGARAGPRVR